MKKIFRFCKECVAELKKVSWPSIGEVLSSMRVLVISIVVLAVILGALDFLFMGGYSFVFTGKFLTN
ncbi:MAG: preprotein translocase subunit SecE [Treponema sp.]|nr:preprotein translocase subunit SecE [Treponema sp.]MBR6192628.1 preprotein translocase subunit SecE [Treponema sp.]